MSVHSKHETSWLLARDKSSKKKMEYQLYPRRWLFLLNVSLLNTMCTMIMVSFSPVATLVTQYYQISGDQVDLLPLVAMGLNVVGMVSAIYCIGKFKLLVALRYSTGITLAGGIVRGLSTAFSAETIGRTTQFWITFTGQIIISLGVPIVIPMSTKTSQVWFGENERPISTSILSLSPVLGGILGQAISPAVMRDDPQNVPILNLVIVSPLLLTFLSSWFLLKSAEPPTPPSRSAEQLLLQKSPSLTQICANMLKIIKNPTVFTIILCQGLGSGMTQTLLTQLNQLMCSRNYTINQSTWTAIINILVGFLGAFTINYFAKKYKLQVEVSKIGFALACTSTIVMMVALDQYEMLWLIMVGFAGFGLFGYAAYPMSLELAVEESYPTDASISEAFMHIAANASSGILILLGNILYKDLGPGSPNQCKSEGDFGVEARDYTPYYYWVMSLATLFPILFILFAKPSMRRSNADDDIE